MKIGLIGAGAIAQFLLKEINRNQRKNLQISSILVRNKDKYQSLASRFGVKLFTELDDFLDSDIDLVVEAANIEAVKNLLPSVIKKKDVVIISIGAFAEPALLTEMNEQANKNGHKIYLPSGAIGGLDLLQNANALGTVESVMLTTRKPAESLIEVDIQKEQVIFEGRAVDAIKQFPKNLNVSIVLSIAGIGMEKTTVRLIADPNIDKNVHQIDISGDFGKATFAITNNPLPENPKTSFLAAMSILGTLQRIEGNLRIGD